MKHSLSTLFFIVIFIFTIHLIKANAADTASIASVSDDGDGTKWIISTADRATVSTWEVGDDVVEIEDSKSCAQVEIVNTDEGGDQACANQIVD